MNRTARHSLAAIMVLPMLALPVQWAGAQGAPSEAAAAPDLVDRFYRGRAVIAAAANAVGGPAALRGLNALSYELDGPIFNDVQGYSASRIGNPASDGRQRLRNRIDWGTPRFSQTVVQSADSGFGSAFATIWTGGTLYSPRWVPRDYSQQDNAPSPFQPGGAVMVSSRWLPPVILKRALQNQRSAYWIGEGAIGGEPTDIVDFTFDEATRFRLHVARGSHLIRRVETIAPDPISADDVTIAEFSGDKIAGGLHFPDRIKAMRRGFVNQDFAMTAIAVNPAFEPGDFAPPEGFTRLPAASPQLVTTQVSGRVYEVSGLAGGTYQVPFVVMDDFVVAYEAPLGIAQTRQVIAEIRKAAPGKPIRYVVVSHFHADHAGGIGAYAEEGATVLSAATNEAVLLTYARANRPQSQGQEGIKRDLTMKFEPVPEAGMTITDAAGGKLEVVGFSRNSHVEQMLALYDPQSGVFMGADHYIQAVTWNPTFTAAARWIARHGGAKLILGTHNRPIARDAFLRLARQPQATQVWPLALP